VGELYGVPARAAVVRTALVSPLASLRTTSCCESTTSVNLHLLQLPKVPDPKSLEITPPLPPILSPSRNHGTSPPLPLPPPTQLTRALGPQLRKSTKHALPLPGATSRLPGHHRHGPDAAPQTHNRRDQHPRVRKMARAGPEGNIEEGVEDPGGELERFPNPGFE